MGPYHEQAKVKSGLSSRDRDAEHHTWFINEVMDGSQICIYARMVARSAKMIHYAMLAEQSQLAWAPPISGAMRV